MLFTAWNERCIQDSTPAVVVQMLGSTPRCTLRRPLSFVDLVRLLDVPHQKCFRDTTKVQYKRTRLRNMLTTWTPNSGCLTTCSQEWEGSRSQQEGYASSRSTGMQVIAPLWVPVLCLQNVCAHCRYRKMNLAMRPSKWTGGWTRYALRKALVTKHSNWHGSVRQIAYVYCSALSRIPACARR